MISPKSRIGRIVSFAVLSFAAWEKEALLRNRKQTLDLILDGDV